MGCGGGAFYHSDQGDLMKPSIATLRLTRFEEAKQIVLQEARSLGVEDVALTMSIGHVVPRDLVAEANLPPFDNSAMDGYAVRSSDTKGATQDRPVKLRLDG